MAKFGFNPAGHAGKSLIHALATLPHDLLISFTTRDLERVATTMMSLVERPRPHLAICDRCCLLGHTMLQCRERMRCATCACYNYF